jgi:hypothetical protein
VSLLGSRTVVVFAGSVLIAASQGPWWASLLLVIGVGLVVHGASLPRR